MTDREKVVEALEYCVGMFAAEPCTQCPYVDEDMCDYMVMRDALELLKEVENA